MNLHDSGKGVSTTTSEVDQLKLEQTKIAIMQDIADKQGRLAALGIPDVSTRKGTIFVSGETPVEGVMLAYQALNKLAIMIAARVKVQDAKCVIIHNPAVFKSLESLRVFTVQVDLMKGFLNLIKDEGVRALDTVPTNSSFVAAAATPFIGAAISSVVQLASLFRVDETVNYGKITIDDQTLAVTVAGFLQKENVTVHDTSLTPINLKPVSSASNIMRSLQEVRALRGDLVSLGDQLTKAINATTTQTAQPSSPPIPALAILTEAKTKIVAAVAEFDEFQIALGRIDDTTGSTRLLQMLDAEELRLLLVSKTYFLWLHVVASGGGTQTKQSIFRSTLGFSGGRS